MLQARRTTPVLLLCLFALAMPFAHTAAVAADGEVLLRLRPTESGTYPMRVDQTQETTIDLGPMGQQEVAGGTVFEGHFKVTPLGGGGLEMETVYERFTMTLNHQGQETTIDSETVGDAPEAQALKRMTGKPIAVQLDDTGRVLQVTGASVLLESLIDGGDEDPEVAALTEVLKSSFSDESLSAMAQQAQAIYPQDAVRVGDSWTASFDFSNPAIGDVAAETEYKLVELSRYKGRDAAKLDLVTKMKIDGDMPMIEQMNAMFAQQGGSMDIDFDEFDSTGSVWIDLETGLTLESTLDQSIDIAMNLNMAEQEMAMSVSVASVTRSQFFQIDE